MGTTAVRGRARSILIGAAFIALSLVSVVFSQQADSYFSGDGGKGKSIAILAPNANGLANDQGYLPALVQGEFVSNFSTYSAIAVLDRERLDTIFVELISPVYSDSAIAKQAKQIGNLAHTTHIMGGNITKTATGYALQIHITKTDNKTAAASYSGTLTFAELDNLTGVRRASLELLKKMGVALSAKAREELAGAAAENRVNAQTALAKGVTAHREKSEVTALNYYFQAAAFDPSLIEAANRSSKLNADITSGSMGDNIRNDIQWRKEWVARLEEAERFFDDFNKSGAMPYTLYYSNNIKQGNVNYKTETVNLSVGTCLFADGGWAHPAGRALQAVYDGLNATKRMEAWQLSGWPRNGVTNLNAFSKRAPKISVVFELLNNQNKVIGRQELGVGNYWRLNENYRRMKIEIEVSPPESKILYFQNVNANDITDKMTIRAASVNGIDAVTAAKNGALQIKPLSGVTKGAALKDSRDGKSYRTVIIGAQRWMAENLNHKTDGSRCYGNDASNCAKYGRLYNWSEAMSGCPAGWRLPTDSDWDNVVVFASISDGEREAVKKIKSKTGWKSERNGTDDYGFSALPGGYGDAFANSGDGLFMNAGAGGYWWSAAEPERVVKNALNRYINYSDDVLEWRLYEKEGLFSVRCVQD